jgi:hypothetical protein
MIPWAALLGGLVALGWEGSARAFVIDTRADERRPVAPDGAAAEAAPGEPQSTTGALLGDELNLVRGPGFVLVRGGLAVAEAACAAQPIATATLSDTVQRVERALGVDAAIGIVLSSTAPSCNSIYYAPLANDVRGIGYGHDDGRELFDDTPDSGLEGVAFLNDWPYWRAHAEEFASAFQHEVAHRWGARVQARIDGEPSNELLGRGLAHWSYFLDTAGSPHEGNVWIADELGQHSETPAHGSRFSPLDLYLMGVGLPAEVEPFQLLRNARVPGLDCRGKPVSAVSPPQTCASVEAMGQPVSIAIEDILAVEGPRQPPASHAVRRLSALVIVLDGTRAPFDAASCHEFAGVLAQRFADFRAATADRLQLEPALAGQGDCDEAAWTPPAPPPSSSSEPGGCSVSAAGATSRRRSVRRPAGTGAVGALTLLVLLVLAIRASKAHRARLQSPP